MDHAEVVPETDLTRPEGDCYSLPIHGVIKDSSCTTKLRIVFDASASGLNNGYPRYMSMASERSEWDTIKGVQIRAGVVYIYYIWAWRYVCHNSSACHAYVMWEELNHNQVLYMPAIANVVTIHWKWHGH